MTNGTSDLQINGFCYSSLLSCMMHDRKELFIYDLKFDKYFETQTIGNVLILVFQYH